MGPRARSRSIVQAIASTVPQAASPLLTDDIKVSEVVTKRSLSSNNLVGASGSEIANVQISKDTPLSNDEIDVQWKQYVKSFEYDHILDQGFEDSAFNTSIEKYLEFENKLVVRHNKNQDQLAKIEELLGLINTLNVKYTNIIKDTKEFQTQSSELIEQYEEIQSLNATLTEYLSNFENLNEITHFLNKPGIRKIIKSSKFVQTLQKLDQSIKFIKQNPDFKDTEQYMAILKTNLTKVLTLIKNYINNNLNNTYQHVLASSAKLTSQSSNIFLYNEFKNSAFEINKLINILYDKQVLYDNEYEGLLNDVYNNYFNIRIKLLSDVIKKHFQESQQYQSLLQYFQDSLNFYVNLINDEYEIFYKFFNDFKLQKSRGSFLELDFNDTLVSSNSLSNLNSSTSSINDLGYENDPEFNYYEFLDFGSAEFFQWTESSLLEQLYDNIRNKILRESDIKTLCRLIELVQKYNETGNDEYEDDAMENYDNFSESYDKFHINFGKLFNPIFTDLQSRLIFRIEVFTEEKITKYKPKLIDFEGVSKEEDEMFRGWYPTLKVAIKLLTQINQLINSTIFDDLAHTVIHLCIRSLKTGYEFGLKAVGTKKAQLFLMKNLLLLKANIDNFDIDFTKYNDVDIDFSGITEIFQKFRSSEYRSVGGIIQLAKDSAPKIVNNIYDAKYELQMELRNVVHEFIKTIVDEMNVPLSKDFKESKDYKALMETYKSHLRKTFQDLKELLQGSIDDQVIITYLLDGIKELTVKNYEVYYDHVVEIETDREALNELLDLDILLNFLNETTASIF